MNNFWEVGGVVDFSECTDPRAKELERRTVLSQYLTTNTKFRITSTTGKQD